MWVMGIDVGTGGARALISDREGTVLAEANVPFPPSQLAGDESGRFEQDPRVWRRAVMDAVTTAVRALRAEDGDPARVKALSVTSTSGTLCLVDDEGEPVGPAIMYSDTRTRDVADVVHQAGEAIATKLGTRFSASYALPRLYWLQRHAPERLARARWCTSPTDLTLGWLSGEWDHMDWTNALKWGYDVVDLEWPAFIGQALGLPMDKLPRVVAPGTVIGQIAPEVARELGLADDVQVVAGATDGTASQLASGAVTPGDWNSTLGTTLVLKGVSETLLRDPLGRIYCHRHPDGYWLPGGASSTGAECLTQRFAAADMDALNATALAHSPTDLVVYPLVRQGERFPFNRPEATGFVLGEAKGDESWWAAHLEGLAYVERMAYEVVEGLGGEVGETIYAVGGATASGAGLQIRADVLDRALQVPEVPQGAMGAAILAAGGTAFDTVGEAARAMVRYAQRIAPRPGYHERYMANYRRFYRACRERGYVE